MITCSSASLIKLCVVFVLNISLFTTGTAPPLLSSKRPNPQQDESAIKTSSTTEWSQTTIGSYSDRTESPPPRVPSSTTLSPPPPTSHVNVTGGRPSSEIKPTSTFSTIKLSTLSSSLSTTSRSRSRGDAENLEGSTTSSSSLSKKFEDLLPFSTSPPPPTLSRLPHSSKEPIIVDAVKSKISEDDDDKVSDIIGATRRSSDDGESERASSKYRVTSSSSSHSVLVDYVGELSPRVTYSTSSSKFETADGEQSHEGEEEEFLSASTTTTTTTTTTPTTSPTSSLSSPEMLTSTKMGDFLSTRRSQKDDNTISTATFSTGNAIITTETGGGGGGGGVEDLFSEDQMMMEFNDDAYSAVEDDDETFSIGIMFDKDYSPEEIAEYIFLTGDERGVASTINDLINDGLMLSRTETIKFLESVKAHLTDLRSRYQEFLIVSEDAEDSGGGESVVVTVGDNNGESGDTVTPATTNIPT